MPVLGPHKLFSCCCCCGCCWFHFSFIFLVFFLFYFVFCCFFCVRYFNSCSFKHWEIIANDKRVFSFEKWRNCCPDPNPNRSYPMDQPWTLSIFIVYAATHNASSSHTFYVIGLFIIISFYSLSDCCYIFHSNPFIW